MDLEKLIEGDGMLAAEGIKIPTENKPSTGESDITGKFVSHSVFLLDVFCSKGIQVTSVLFEKLTDDFALENCHRVGKM